MDIRPLALRDEHAPQVSHGGFALLIDRRAHRDQHELALAITLEAVRDPDALTGQPNASAGQLLDGSTRVEAHRAGCGSISTKVTEWPKSARFTPVTRPT